MTPAGYQPKITVVDPDPAWPATFQAEAADIQRVLGGAARRIEHHGSTAVPDLAAKPIIDIQVSVAAMDVADLEERLGRLGYVRVPWPGDADDYPFFAKPAEGFRTHHIHACLCGSLEEHRHLAMRDYLCAHPDEAAAYGALKRDLATRYDGDRQAYVDGKDAYVKALEARALAWAPSAS